MKSFDQFPSVPNEEARAMLIGDKDLYLKTILKCVEESIARIYDPPPPGCIIVFTEPKPAHYSLRLNIIGADSDVDNKVSSDREGYDVSNDVRLHTIVYIYY